MLPFKSKSTSIHLIFTYGSWFIVLTILFLLSFFALFSMKHSHSNVHHRLKRQSSIVNSTIDDKKHYTQMLRRILANRFSSSLLSDCTINVGSDEIYRLPANNTLSSEIIHLVEHTCETELRESKRLTMKIRSKLDQNLNYFSGSSYERIRNDFGLDFRLLLASQKRVKQIDLISSANENGPPFRIKYFRSNRSIIDAIDYENVQEEIYSDQIILQSFTVLNAHETLIDHQQNNSFLIQQGWWLGPVLCEKNSHEASLMAHISPLSNSHFLVTYFNISLIDINQCASRDLPFGNSHKCPRDMQCYFQAGHGFALGAYECMCKGPHGNTTITMYGTELERNESYNGDPSKSIVNTCECNPESCLLIYNNFMRTVIVVIQSIFIVLVAILAAIVFQRRKLKIIKHSMWILLELILLGAALLYGSVIVDSFGPHGVVCLIMPWLRELGFTIVYGTLILRIYKMLAEFQSRKAHCVQVKEKDILRILFFMAISIIGYLLGWTFVNVDHTNENLSLDKYLLGHGFTLKNKRYFRTCRPRSWDYLVQCAEFIFLCVGIRFIYSTRTAPCEYHERKLITFAIVCEMLFSTLLHVIRDCLWASIDPDSLFILSFVRCHFTVTCMIIFIYCTKLCYIFRPFHDEYTGRDRIRSLAEGVEPVDLVTKLQSNGDIEFGELSIRDMDPEEIRAELKRLYTSLHVLKTKTLRTENPHLTKRQGQRRKPRRFSIQTFQRHTSNVSGGVTGALSHVFNVGAAASATAATSGGEKHDRESTKTPDESTDEGEEVRGRALSDAASPTTGVNQRVTFK